MGLVVTQAVKAGSAKFCPNVECGESSFFLIMYLFSNFFLARSEFMMNNYVFFVICRHINSLEIYYS